MTSISEQLDQALAAGGDAKLHLPKERWYKVCVCGHQGIYHGTGIGGTFGADDQYIDFRVDGCRGAAPARNEPPPVHDRAAGTTTVQATCPCRQMRPVAEVDRPGRLMRQKPSYRDEVHPMFRGLKALRTWFAGRKSIKDPDAELNRRFRWIDGAQKCEECGTVAEDVLPRYVNGTRNSEMRCPRH